MLKERKLTSMRRLLHRPYYGLRRIIETDILGTKAQELIWRTRHIYKGTGWARTYCDTLDHPHRALLAQAIRSFAPFEQVLEIGSNSGPNLYILAREYPQAKFLGIDINPKAIQVGREWMQSSGIHNVQLAVGQADELGEFGDKSIDVAFTDAILI